MLGVRFSSAGPLLLIGLCSGLQAGKYDLNQVLEKSLLFYEAQRSGPLPDDNRVSWRGDSALDDEIPGGYYDAGDHVKFNFPMAATTTVLAWSGISFREGYEAAEQIEWLGRAIRWATDYFIACHTADTELVGQVGDGYADHGYWGRPEEMTMDRPAFRITADQPGSELAGETAAALAAASIFFRDHGDPEYANECLSHARSLLDFADNYRGTYTDAIPAGDFYNSWSGYNDEIIWAAAWVALATGSPVDLERAEALYVELGGPNAQPSEVGWDDKSAYYFLLMMEVSGGKEEYRNKVEAFLNYILSQERTPNGLVWIGSSTWGSLRHASNLANFAVHAARLGVMEAEGLEFAESQLNYILGDGVGHSFVVGFGENPPQRPHHRASSCPDLPAPCGWPDMANPGPNPQVLNGALVGGPDKNDQWEDDRNNFQTNEVACDYNAGFQSLVAALNQNQN